MKLKRILSVALMAALVIGVLPMVAMGLTAGKAFYAWTNSNPGTIDDLSANPDTTDLQTALGDSVVTSGIGVIVDKPYTMTGDVTKNDKYLVLNDVAMRVKSGQTLHVKLVLTTGSGKLIIEAGGTIKQQAVLSGAATIGAPGSGAALQMKDGTVEYSMIQTSNGNPITAVSTTGSSASLTPPVGSNIAGKVVIKGNADLTAGDGSGGASEDEYIVASGATLNVTGDAELNGKITVNGGLTVASGKTFELQNGSSLEVNGTLDLGKDGTLGFKNTGGSITINGKLRLDNPNQLSNITTISGNGTIYSDNPDVLNLATGSLKTGSYAAFIPPTYSHAEYISANTPYLSAPNPVYGGYGDFVINSTGLFVNFDPDKSLYANGTKLTAGVDYDVVDKSGFAQFTIYESFMQTLSGNVVFKATFKNGFSGSMSVNVQSAYVPEDITASVPKTGTNTSAAGFALIIMALALAAVAKRARA